MINSSQDQLAKRAPTIAILVMVGAYALCNSHFNVMMSPIIKAFNLAGADQGLLSSVMSFGSMLALLLMPMLQGRINKLWLLFLSMSVQVLMLLAAAVSPNFNYLIMVYLVLGLGGGWTDTTANSLMVDLHGDDSAKQLGMLHGFFSIGAVITPLLMQWLLLGTDWRGTYAILAVVAGLLVLVSMVMLVKSRRVLPAQLKSAQHEVKLTREAVKAYLLKKRNILLILACILIAAAQGLVGWVAHYMTVRYDQAVFGSLTVAIFWVATAISRIFAPRLNIAALKLLTVGAVLAAVFNVIGVLSGNAVIMFIMTAAVGLASGHSIPLLLSEGTRDYANSTSLPTSVLLLVMFIGRIIIPLLMGSFTVISTIDAAMLLPAVAALLAGLVGWALIRMDRAESV